MRVRKGACNTTADKVQMLILLREDIVDCRRKNNGENEHE